MGISLITALSLAFNEAIVPTYAGPDKDGKYTGIITLGPEDNYRALISSAPSYDSPETATAAMVEVIKEVKANMKYKNIEEAFEDITNAAAQKVKGNQ